MDWNGPDTRLGRRGFLASAATAVLPGPAITVSSKIDTEGAILGQVLVQALRARGVAVTARLQLGPTRILRQAILAGAVDLVAEYTGNGANFFNQETDPVWHDPDAAYRRVRDLDSARNNLMWLHPAPANNGWGIAVRKSFASNSKLGGMVDLGGYVRGGGRFMLAASAEFADSPDALPAFEKIYGFRLRQDQLLMLAGGDTSATLRAAAEGLSGVNAAMAYGTDGALGPLGMVLLQDERHAQIAYQPAPVIRRAALAARPQVALWLEPVFAALTAPALQAMNARVAAEGADPAQVAARFLEGTG